MFNMNTIDQALGPLAKVQKNLETVSANRAASAVTNRERGNASLDQAKMDDSQKTRANAILVKLNKLLDPQED